MECKKNMSFEECELAILRQAVDKADLREGENMLKDPDDFEECQQLYGDTGLIMTWEEFKKEHNLKLKKNNTKDT